MTHFLHERGSVFASPAPFACASMKRFDARFWTVDFPRPAMAALTTPGTPETRGRTMRVDCTFYNRQELVGLIWEAEDRWDHPLCAYETARDFRACRLSFRWRSAGMKPLDERHGPTLTIEGRDASGAAKAWYVRLWNYASGTPTDARIALDFGALTGGYLWPDEADPVWAGDIDRMFISLVPPDYDKTEGVLPAPLEAWAELTDIMCSGAGSVLRIGDAMLPETGLSVATGYDDCYHMTPARVVHNALTLGYRGDLNHYVGMSHYFRLEANSGGFYISLAGGTLNGPCAAWHRDFCMRAKAAGYGIIWSLSYELFAQHCWNDWIQRAADGSPALTGWEPPSALLSPANAGAMGYLQLVARAFVGFAVEAGLPSKFQVGEPWWWVRGDGTPCLYDGATSAALGSASVPIADMRGSLTAPQKAMLDRCGEMLAASTLALAAAAKDAGGAQGCTTHLLIYLPTILDSKMPEASRANVPVGWHQARPGAFDILQLEDYDWAAEGLTVASARGVAVIEERLGYPVERQHYLSGFVLKGEDAARQWPAIMAAARTAARRGVAATFLWALPQICRDGLTAYPYALEEEQNMLHFDNVRFPIAIGREASVLTEFSTAVVESASGHEQRMVDWSNARMRYDAGPGLRSEADVAALTEFFRARRGAAKSFRFRDPFDGSSSPTGAPVTPLDQPLGTGDGLTTRFGLYKHYGPGAEAQRRPITRAVVDTVCVAVNGVEVTNWFHMGLGIIQFDEAPPKGAVLTVGYEYDVPVRFASDRLEVSRATFLAGEIASVPLVEVREF